MDRLTERTKDGILVKEGHGENVLRTLYQCYGGKPLPHYENCEEGYCAMEKLAAYEDAEEQGLMLKLQCKVGDTVWDNDFGKPCAYTITGFSLGTGEDYIDEPVSEKEIVYYCSNSSGSITESFAAIEIGKTVFLTQEQAEEALKKMRGTEEK